MTDRDRILPGLWRAIEVGELLEQRHRTIAELKEIDGLPASAHAHREMACGIARAVWHLRSELEAVANDRSHVADMRAAHAADCAELERRRNGGDPEDGEYGGDFG